MTDGTYLRTIDLARAVAMSVQQVRNYEAWGFLPPSQRGKQGYRLYTQQHLAALKTARSLINAYGWRRSLTIMCEVHQGKLSTALALVDARHAELASKRLQVEQTLEALRALTGQSVPRAGLAHPRKLRVGEAAQQVGVRASALHFWEQQGLLSPRREPNSRYRLYDEQQMHRLRVIVLLREAGYDFEAIHSVLAERALGRPEKAIQAIERRGEDLSRRSWACVEALSSLRAYIYQFQPDVAQAFLPPQKKDVWQTFSL
ncbi:MAG TPA: MerR family transcriptional regulator [Ktedonobacteraceae bacterium]|nr:MerR family transcriptional regulator [Ktedonobacteraceae bacterium]